MRMIVLRGLILAGVALLLAGCFPLEDILVDDGSTETIADTVYIPTPPDTVVVICHFKKHGHHTWTCDRWEPR